MATQDATTHPLPAQARVAQTISIAVYELKLFPLTVHPKRLHPHSAPSLIVPSCNHSQPHRGASPANRRKSTFGTRTGRSRVARSRYEP
jgi:hypothetical protein